MSRVDVAFWQAVWMIKIAKIADDRRPPVPPVAGMSDEEMPQVPCPCVRRVCRRTLESVFKRAGAQDALSCCPYTAWKRQPRP